MAHLIFSSSGSLTLARFPLVWSGTWPSHPWFLQPKKEAEDRMVGDVTKRDICHVTTVTNERDDRHERTWWPSRTNVMTVTNKRDDHHETKISHKPWLYFTHRHKLNRIYRPPCCRAQWPSTANYGAIRRILQSPELKKGLVKNSLIPWILDK